MIHNDNTWEKSALMYVSLHLNTYDLLHTLGVVTQTRQLSKKLSKKDAECLILAAYFHDYSKREGIKTHHLTSAKVALDFLTLKKYPLSKEVSAIILSHSYPIKKFYDPLIENPAPKSLLQLLLIKADMLEQITAAGKSRIFSNNLEKMDFEKNLVDVEESVTEAKSILKWVNNQLRLLKKGRL